jgi:hypothetical protein
MSKTTVQFVGFTSRLDPEEFISLWVPFARKLNASREGMMLDQNLPQEGSQRFHFVSRHSSGPVEFNFAFMKGRDKPSFPENKARVMQLGGYMPMKTPVKRKPTASESRILAFVPHEERDLSGFRELDSFMSNRFEAYYENCAYGNILEYFLPKKQLISAVSLLKSVRGVDAGEYKERSTVHVQETV